MHNHRCIVFGAGGFIGSRLCEILAPKFTLFKAFGRSQSQPQVFKDCHWISGDFNDINQVTNALVGCDTVIHLVNATTPASANFNRVAELKSNVLSTLNMLDACASAGIKKIIFLSSGGTVYGIPQELPTTERAETHPITAYGVSKLTIEKYLYLYKHLFGIKNVILRVSNPYGPYQTAKKNQGVIAAFLKSAHTKSNIEVWGDGTVIRDYVYIDDVVSAIYRAIIYEGEETTFNIGSGIGHSINDLLTEISKILERELTVEYKPSRSVDVPSSILNIESARIHLDWKPSVGFEEGLTKTVEWSKTNLE